MTLKHLFKNFFSKNKKINENISIIPNHVAVIMDGNNRWAKKNFVPGVAGHKAGIEAIRQVLEICDEYSIQTLTLFAFREYRTIIFTIIWYIFNVPTYYSIY